MASREASQRRFKMIDIAKIVADAPFSIVTTLDNGETVIAKARTREAAERIYNSASQVVGKLDWNGRIRTKVEIIEA